MIQKTSMGLTCAVLASLLWGCGGSGSDGGDPPSPPPPPATTPVAVTVIDGAIRNARVCLDVNGSGACDDGEPAATTDATGRATLEVPNDRVGRHPVVAMVGTDAVDADLGPVTTPFTLTAPADRTAVISPLTTLAQHLVRTQGLESAAADRQLQSASGLSVSAYEDFTQKRATEKASADAGLVAAAIVATVQSQFIAVQGAIGMADASGVIVSRAEVEAVVRGAAMDALPEIAAAVAQPALQDACRDGPGTSACMAEVRKVADRAVEASGLTTGGVLALAAIARSAVTPEGAAGSPGAVFRWLNFGGSTSADWYYRVHLANAEEDTAINGLKKWRNLRRAQIGGTLFEWGWHRDYNRRNDSHWNGAAWVSCPDASFQHTATVRDALGRLAYDVCDGREKGVAVQSSEPISGKSLAEVVKRIRAFPGWEGGSPAGTPYARWGDPLSGPPWTDAQLDGFFGTEVFPARAELRFSTATVTETAYTYDVRSSNRVFLFGAAIAAGGDARTGSPACASVPAGGSPDVLATRLEDLLILKGAPCRFDPQPPSAQYEGSGSPNDWYGNSTISLGRLGTEPTGTPGPVVPAPHFTSNVLLRVAFTGDAADRAVTYLRCRERRSSSSTRNCTPIGSGTYEIAQLGDARVMTFRMLPLDTAALTYERIFVERAGAVYFGFRNKPASYAPQIRLNLEAANAVLTKLGFAPLVP